MTTQTNKQVKITTDANFNNNKIINAKIDANENDISGVTKVYDVKVNNESIVKDRIADIEFSEEGNNTYTYVYDDKIYVDFSGLGIIKQSFLMNNEESASWHDSHNVEFPYWIHVSVGTLILRNGQLLLLSDDYHIIAENKINILETISENDIITVINGLSVLSVVTGVTGDELYTGDYVDDSTLVFKNGILLSNGYDFTNSQGTITFETDLNSNDKIVLIRAVTGIPTIEIEANSYELSYSGPHDNLIFKNGLFMSLGLDYEIETIDFGQSQFKIHFYEELQEGDIVTMIYNEPYSIYTLLGDKQNKLPLYEPGKVLGTDGNRLMWVNAGGGTDDGIFHPRNGDELNDIINNEPGYSKTIDFSNFDFNTFYSDGYTINEKSFTIRNFSMGSNWGAWQFNWMKSPLFTLNNGATLYFQNLVINVQDWYCDPGDGSEAENTAPLLRANNGSHISITNGGMININNVTGIDKYVAIELNNSNTYIQNFGITINSYDENRPDDINSLTCAIECNGFSYAENNFDRAGFDISGNTTEKYGIKYNDDLGGFIKINGGGFNVDGGDGYSIYCSNKTILELSFVNVGKIDSMPITVKQLSPNTDYYKDDIIEINGKLYKVTQDFNSNDYNNIEDGYGQVYEDFWTVNVTGTMYSIEDPNERISSYETTDNGYRANGLILSSDDWNLPISDQNLTSDNAQDAIKELAAKGTGANLYDIKLLSQAIADKGWACLSHSLRKDIAKADIPTMYADIKNKYDNCDKSYNVSTISNTSYSNVMYDDYSHKYYYRDTSVKLYSSDNADLSNPSEVNLGSGDISDFFMLGDNINITTYGFNTSGSDYYIYDKDWNYIKTIHFDSEYNNVVKFRKVNGSFVIFVSDSDPYHKVCYLIKISDDENANVTISNNYFNSVSVDSAKNISDVIDDKIYISLNRNGYYITFLEIDYTNLSLIQTYNANTLDSDGYGNLTNIIKYNNTFYYGNLRKLYSSSDLVNWTEVHSFSTFIYYIEKYNDTYYIISNGYITKTTDFLNFETIITFTGTSSEYDNGYIYGYFNNQIIITFSTFVSYTPLYLYASDVATIYTDNYNINGTTVSINYYKYHDFKICQKDSGTNDTNLATVYSYLGYYNYYRLDTENETISLPRNSNLWTYMYVGDNYEDSNLPSGNATRVLLQANTITDLSSSTITFDENNRVQSNASYKFGELTSLTLGTNSIINSELGTTIKFTSGLTQTTLTDNSDIEWIDGSTPTPSASKTCLIFVWDNTGFYKEW